MAEVPHPPGNAVTDEHMNAKEPARFIRTFAADMEKVKAGKRPDLVPYADQEREAGNVAASKETMMHPAVPPRPPQSEPRMSVPSTPLPVPPPPVPEPDTRTEPVSVEMARAQEPDIPDMLAPQARLVAGSVLPPQPPAEAVEETPPPEPIERASEAPSPIHTYRGDFTERMKDTEASAATVLAAEQDAGFSPFAARTRHSHGNAGYLIAGAVLILFGAAGAYWGYMRYASIPVPVVLAPTVSAPIFVDTDQIVSGSGSALAGMIAESMRTPLTNGAIRFLHFPASASTTESVFSALELPAPGELLRNINPAGSMAGIVNAGGVSSPFFILSVDSYSETFSGMLAWEPQMLSAFPALYPPLAPPLSATSTTPASTTPRAFAATSTMTATSTPGFEDVTIANHDARAYFDAYGRPLIVYGYWDQHTLVIARDENAFTEILSRLANSKK